MSGMSGLCPENVHILSKKFSKHSLKIKHNKEIRQGQKSDIFVQYLQNSPQSRKLYLLFDENCYNLVYNTTNQIKRNKTVSNENFVRTDEVESKMYELVRKRDELFAICDDKNNPPSDIKEELENLRQEMQDLINPNRQYERLGVDVLLISVAENVVPIVDPDKKGSLLTKLSVLRYKLTDELGYILPNVRILDSELLKPNQYSIYIKGKQVFIGKVTETDIENNNCSKIINNLKEICIKYVHQIITKTDVLKLMELIKSQDPTLVNDLIPIFLSPIDIKKILANLISQNISIKDVISVFEILNDHARYTQDIKELTKILKKELNFTNK